MTTPGDTSMASLQEVQAVMKGRPQNFALRGWPLPLIHERKRK
jgi:hypothetical protein